MFIKNKFRNKTVELVFITMLLTCAFSTVVSTMVSDTSVQKVSDTSVKALRPLAFFMRQEPAAEGLLLKSNFMDEQVLLRISSNDFVVWTGDLVAVDSPINGKPHFGEVVRLAPGEVTVNLRKIKFLKTSLMPWKPKKKIIQNEKIFLLKYIMSRNGKVDLLGQKRKFLGIKGKGKYCFDGGIEIGQNDLLAVLYLGTYAKKVSGPVVWCVSGTVYVVTRDTAVKYTSDFDVPDDMPDGTRYFCSTDLLVPPHNQDKRVLLHATFFLEKMMIMKVRARDIAHLLAAIVNETGTVYDLGLLMDGDRISALPKPGYSDNTFFFINGKDRPSLIGYPGTDVRHLNDSMSTVRIGGRRCFIVGGTQSTSSALLYTVRGHTETSHGISVNRRKENPPPREWPRTTPSSPTLSFTGYVRPGDLIEVGHGGLYRLGEDGGSVNLTDFNDSSHAYPLPAGEHITLGTHAEAEGGIVFQERQYKISRYHGELAAVEGLRHTYDVYDRTSAHGTRVYHYCDTIPLGDDNRWHLTSEDLLIEIVCESNLLTLYQNGRKIAQFPSQEGKQIYMADPKAERSTGIIFSVSRGRLGIFLSNQLKDPVFIRKIGDERPSHEPMPMTFAGRTETGGDIYRTYTPIRKLIASSI